MCQTFECSYAMETRAVNNSSSRAGLHSSDGWTMHAMATDFFLILHLRICNPGIQLVK